MSRARYENTSNYDPGRFRYSLSFFIPQNDEGTQWQLVATRRAIREVIVKRANIEGFLQLNAGESVLYEMWNFVIRKGSFVPLKDMVVTVGSDIYTIRTISEVDEPANYYRILCVKTDLNLTT